MIYLLASSMEGVPTQEQIIDRLLAMSKRDPSTYSLWDRQQVLGDRIPYCIYLASDKKKAKALDRERKVHKAREMRLLEWTVKDRENKVEESEEYQALCIWVEEAEYKVDVAQAILPLFSELVTTIRDAERIIEQQT